MGYWAVVEKEVDRYCAYFPDITGVVVRARTIEELKVLLQEALIDHLKILQQSNEPIPRSNFNPTTKTTHPKKIPQNIVEYLYITMNK